jgi:D-alanyl-D-alanine endopeptidase (penicillin-binding protein 7)
MSSLSRPPRLRLGLATVLLALGGLLLPAEGALAARAHPASHAKKSSTTKSAKTHRSAKKRVVVKRSSARHAVAKKKTARRHTIARKAAPRRTRVAAVRPAPRPLSVATRAGLYAVPDPLRLHSSVAYVIDQDTQAVLLQKNASAVLPIASLTKLMTGMVIAEARLPMEEKITITGDDVDRLKGSSSRLRVGTELTRRQALHLALMSSENRAAHALARTYPGGESAFVSAMNIKARQLGMDDTRYVEPTGLSPQNQSTAEDLATLAAAAYTRPLLRQFTTSPGYQLAVDHGALRYVNTNRLVRGGSWEIGLQKTGFINEAGQCMLMQAKLAGRKLIMVFLDGAGQLARIRDAQAVRRWIEAHPTLAGTPARDEDS